MNFGKANPKYTDIFNGKRHIEKKEVPTLYREMIEKSYIWANLQNVYNFIVEYSIELEYIISKESEWIS